MKISLSTNLDDEENIYVPSSILLNWLVNMLVFTNNAAGNYHFEDDETNI